MHVSYAFVKTFCKEKPPRAKRFLFETQIVRLSNSCIIHNSLVIWNPKTLYVKAIPFDFTSADASAAHVALTDVHISAFNAVDYARMPGDRATLALFVLESIEYLPTGKGFRASFLPALIFVFTLSSSQP